MTEQAMTFRFDRTGQITLETGRLTLGGRSYMAISGPHRNGRLPFGTYAVEVRKSVVEDLGQAAGPLRMAPGFHEADKQRAWFIPITPANINTPRSGLGIHPDGNTRGTEGCIGIIGADASAFWHEWTATPINLRPRTLFVE